MVTAKKQNRPNSVQEVQARAEERLGQLEDMLAAGEKCLKTKSLEFSKRLFNKAQEAFEKCESINQQADEWLEDTAAKHGGTKKRLAKARQAAAQSVERAASTAAELAELQKEAAQMFAELRSKIIAVPQPTTSGSKRLLAGQGPGLLQKRRKNVTFKERSAASA